MNLIRDYWRLWMLLPCLLVVMPACAQSAGSSDPLLIKVTLQDNHATLNVVQGAHLRVVLQAFCDQTTISCELPSSGLEDAVPPGMLEGTLSQVVDKLLEGSRVSYTFLVPTRLQPGKLIVAPSTEASDSGQRMLATGSNPGMSNPEPPVSPEPMAEVPNQPSNSAAPDTSASSGQGSLLEVPADGVVPSGMNFVPFPGPGGKMQMQAVSYEPLTVAPFPGPDGKPIPVQVTNQPPTVIPWPDGQGHLLPAPPIVPNQKLEYPIPPTPQR